MQKKLFFLVALMLTMTLSVMAQVTTSSMTGKVTMDGSNEEIIGASVQAVHEPSGTRYTAVTNVNGRFTIQGMRTGGPYAVTVSYIGHQTKVMKGVTLQLGETYKLDVWLSENSTDLAEVVVSGRASKFAAEKTGASTNISNQMMMSMPTMSRSIEDMARISPYAGSGMSFAGGDGRSSNFTLDGANLNNNFGLNDGLPGGGTPVSLEAIDEIQVVVAPYDVRQSNFIGGGVNAITKSGTNTFKGTAYTYYQSDKLHGTKIGDYDVTYEKKKQTVYGFTLGGPIIKDKLFFFANYEKSITPQSVVDWRASVDGVADASAKIARTTLADMETVSNFVREKYGYNTGSWTDFNGDKDNTKFIVRLDWNITQNHHLSLRYNTTTDNSWTNTNKTSAPTKLSQSRAASKYSMTFNNSMYSTEKNVNSWSADLNSRFGQHASNQLLFTYTHIKDGRGSDSSKFPFVDILDGTGGLVPYMGLGYELFTWNNGVENNVTTAIDNFTYFLGSHKITAGASFEHQMANNNFMRYGTGYYRYSSLNDFLTGAAPECVALTHGYNGNGNPSNEVRFNQYGLYLQDEWDVTNRLKLNYGIRFDYLQFNDDDVMRNNAIYNLDFGGRHVDTGMWPNSNVQVSPRFGFVWDVMGDKSLKIRGGSGLFAGRLPLVFFTNMPTNSGMIQNIIVAEKGDPRLASFAGGLITDTEQIRTLLGGPTTISPADGLKQSSVVGVDRDFKMPQVWKSSIAIDYNVPVSFPLSLTGEFTYTKKINDVMIENWNIKLPDETWERLVGADNRYIYPNDFRYDSSFSKTDGACILTNTHKGYGWTANVTVNAEPVKNLKLMAAYTHTVVKEVTGMPGSQAASTWANNYTVNGPNQAGLHNSTYAVPDRVIASINYNVYKEHFTLFYTGLPGYDGQSLYSYYYDGDINNDGIATDLIYIPANDSEINFVSEEDRVAFWKFVDQDDYLRNHKGEYAEAFGVRAPWLHRFDFKFAHDIDLKVGNTKHKLQLSCDIMNIGNLLNSEWGVSKSMAPCNNGQFLKVAKIEKGVPYFEMKKVNGEYISKTWEPYRSYGNCWGIQIGAKYYFN